MSINYSTHSGKIRAVVIICCFVLILGILGYAYFIGGNNTVIEKDAILANVDELGDEDYGYEYISSYVKKYGIGNVNSYKFNAIEEQLETDFYKELPEEKEMAKTISLLFVEHYYDSIDIKDKTQVTDALLKCLFASIGDPYAYYRTQEEFAEFINTLAGGEEFVGVGVMMNQETLEIIMVYPGSGADEAGILAHDVIYSVNGKSLTDVSKDDMLALLAGEAGTTVNITVKRGEELIDFTVTRKVLVQRSVYHEITDDGVGIIQITQFLDDTSAQFVEAVDYCIENGAVALVIDVRYNPGGYVHSAVAIADYLTPDAEGRKINAYTYANDEYVYYTVDGHSVDLPIFVLCNEHSASSSELFVAALRDFGKEGYIDVTIIGTTTYGKGVVQTSYTLYDASGITYTIGYSTPPSGENYDGIGITPDIEVPESSEVDAPLARALEEIAKITNTSGNEDDLGAAA